jgi:class 3 adenylate cyclase
MEQEIRYCTTADGARIAYVECAIALQRAMETHNAGVGAPLRVEDAGGRGAAPGGGAAGEPRPETLRVRVGLNAGEPIEEEGDLFGASVILASRIAAKAEGGEILVSDTVRGLCSGKGFLFSDRGEFVAKGFEEPLRVYQVRWRE